MAFGQAAMQWELSDASPPKPMVISASGEAPSVIDRGIVSIPGAAGEAVASIYQAADGQWVVEMEDRIEPVVDGSLIHVCQATWIFSCPSELAVTESFEKPPLLLEAAVLRFRVSADEEAVELDVMHQGRLIPLGSRSVFYLLLTLARLRLAQRDSGSAGWIHWSELATMLRASQVEINVWVHRIRERFAEVGFLRPAAIIERRPRTGQLRIGSDKLNIESM
jgi:hypothetical protein